MQTFLEEVLLPIIKKEASLENYVFVLPSKRAGTFLRDSIAKNTTTTILAPEIYSIESFVEKISGLSPATHTQQFFELYRAYYNSVDGEKDNFYAFTKWGNTLLQDFNEIDRFLIDPIKLFSHLSAIQEINHWSLEKEKSTMISNYLSFWNSLENIYYAFTDLLSKQGVGHQGMLYRSACANLDEYLSKNTSIKHVFIGFNALNTAEEQIITSILEKTQSEAYWDIDPYFLNDVVHDASHFIRKYQKKWPFFKDNPLQSNLSNYNAEKNIKIIGVPKNVSQAKYVGELLANIQNKTSKIRDTAVVLGDETLLNPLLNSIPKEVIGVNITMGYPLAKTPPESFFAQLFELYNNDNSWYYENVLALLNHPYSHVLIGDECEQISNEIKNRNWIYITALELKKIFNTEEISLLFSSEVITPNSFIEKCLNIIQSIKAKLDPELNRLDLEYLYRFHQIFQQLKDMVVVHTVVEDLQSLLSLYREILSKETLDFKGEPLKGLQVMGMLESRNLDFETIILTGVNEGILPSGKSNNSFIPFDLKKQYNLPTYKEKDAVYTYHFYRLLQRAKNIYLLYNTEPDVLEGGEKSRLIRQLLADENISGNITEEIAFPAINSQKKKLAEIAKGDHLMNLIQKNAQKGFSPSSLSNYIRNPLDFYRQNILRINEFREVEESVASNTFGTIVHETLDELYQPFKGQFLEPEKLSKTISKIPELAKKHFDLNYANQNITEGKNLIAYNVIVKYIENFIRQEIELSKKHQIKIIGLEASLEIELNYPELNYPVVLKGKLDRIDEFDGTLRIIDYKTGKVEAKDVKITDWDQITANYDKSKAFQLLCYAVMFVNGKTDTQLEAGIFSFKNLKGGILKFKNGKETLISSETLVVFQQKLKALILEICSINIPFKEKEI